MKMKYFIIVLLLMPAVLFGQQNLADRGKGFYVDKEGKKHEGTLRLVHPKAFNKKEKPTTVSFKDESGKRELDFNEIAYLKIKKYRYIPLEELSFSVAETLIKRGWQRDYTMKNVFLKEIVAGRISMYTHYSLIGPGSNAIECQTDFFEKEGEKIDINKCRENKSYNQCLIEPLKDNDKVYKKYKKLAKITIHSESTIETMYKDYNSYY